MIGWTVGKQKTARLVDSVPIRPLPGALQARGKPDATPCFGLVQGAASRQQAPLWILVADDETLNRSLVLITNIPLTQVSVVQQVYNDWRCEAALNRATASIKNRVGC